MNCLIFKLSRIFLFFIFIFSCFSGNSFADPINRFYNFPNGQFLGFNYSNDSGNSYRIYYGSSALKSIELLKSGVGLKHIQVNDPFVWPPVVDLKAESVQVQRDSDSFSSHTWFKIDKEFFIAFQDGKIAKSCDPQLKNKVVAKIFSYQEKLGLLESYQGADGANKTVFSFNLNGTQCFTIDHQFHPELKGINPVEMVDSSGVQLFENNLFDFNTSCVGWGISHLSKQFHLYSCVVTPPQSEGAFITQTGSQKAPLRLSFQNWDLSTIPGNPFQLNDGILSIQNIDKKVDLERFDEELSFFGNIKPVELVMNVERKLINPLEAVRERYGKKELVQDSRERPELYFERSNPTVINRMAEAIRGGRSPALLGEPGTGKSSAVRAFARDVGKGLVTGLPRTTQIYEVSSSDLGSGTGIIGATEQTMAEIKSAAKALGGIFFFDEIHSLAGTGTHSRQENDITQQIKGAVETGEMRIIATDTPTEFINAFSWDNAFAQRFEKIKMQAAESSDRIKLVQDRFLAKGYGELSSEIVEAAIQASLLFEPKSAQPRPAINLLTMALERMRTLGKTGEPTLAILNEVSKERYGLDPSVFSPTALKAKLADLSRDLGSIGVTQEQAQKSLTAVWKTKLSGKSKRLNSILLVGPSGSGKTWISKKTAKLMGYEANVIDMNSYSRTSRLGVEDFQQQIYKMIEKDPFAVIILEDIDQADISIQASALAMMKEGQFKVTLHPPSGKTVTQVQPVKTALFMMTATLDMPRIAKLPESALRTVLSQKGDQKVSKAIVDEVQYVVALSRPTKEEYQAGVRALLTSTLSELGESYGTTFALREQEKFIQAASAIWDEESDFRDIDQLMRGIEDKALDASMDPSFKPEGINLLNWDIPEKRKPESPLEDLPISVQMIYS